VVGLCAGAGGDAEGLGGQTPTGGRGGVGELSRPLISSAAMSRIHQSNSIAYFTTNLLRHIRASPADTLFFTVYIPR
jgi:hypothetical protein